MRIVGASPEEMDGGTWGPAAGLEESDEPWSVGVKSVLRERNGAASGVDAAVSPQIA